MPREIGSEFWDVPVGEKNNAFFPETVQWFLSGRSALKAILGEIDNCHTVAVPSWCCESMVKPFLDAGMKVHFYPVYWKNEIIQEVLLDCDILLIMDYFGYIGPTPILSGYKGIIIRDVTHSVFSCNYSDADYYFGSLRKWCGVWTGGYAWTKVGTKLKYNQSTDLGYTQLRKHAMELKRLYIHNCKTEKKDYLNVFHNAEEILGRVNIAPADDRDVQIVKNLNIEFLRYRRHQNATILHSGLNEWLCVKELKEGDCPLFVPLIVPGGKRDKLQRYLIENDIFCPVHWPISKYHKLDKETSFLFDNEISLVCDQRYTVNDMNRVIDTIKEFL